MKTAEDLARGDIRTNGEVTLTPNATATEVVSRFVNPDSVVLLSPKTATAAAESPFVTVDADAGTFTVHHATTADTDKVFGYVVLGQRL